jgi:acylphosphatase
LARRGKRNIKKKGNPRVYRSDESPHLASVKVVVSGRVQGVFFRDFTLYKASELDLSGYVRNLPHGQSVEVVAEGNRLKILKLIEFLKIGPTSALVSDVEIHWSEFSGEYSEFRVRY